MTKKPDSDVPVDGDGDAERQRVMRAREKATSARETSLDVRESTSARRELSLTHREELSRAREEAREAAASRDRLLAQMREANEKLVLATMRSQQLAEEANAARAEMALSEERFRSLVTTSTAIVWRADAAGRVEVDPEAWTRFTGARVDGEIDVRLEAVHPADRERVQAAWEAAVESKQGYSIEHRLIRHDGTYAWVAARAVPIPHTGPVREWIGTITDISDRVRVEEARDQFIGILGHDLRTPLNAILMASRLLERSGLPTRATDLAVRISRSARRIDAMTGALLLFARGRLGGGIPVASRECDLAAICRTEVEETRQAYPGRAISCTTSGHLVGDWDPDRLEQLLANLISNAVAHGADPIRVQAHGNGGHVTVSVHNQGPPIAAELLPLLFEPFRSRSHSEGLGLGLYIVSEIARAHGGSISVRSVEGEGTTFTITLPRRTVEPA